MYMLSHVFIAQNVSGTAFGKCINQKGKLSPTCLYLDEKLEPSNLMVNLIQQTELQVT